MPKFCAWCGAECEGRVIGIRYNRLDFITHGTAEAGEGHQETLEFCSVSHRHEYYFGM